MRKTPYDLLLVRVHEIVGSAGLRHEFDTESLFHLRLEQEGYLPLEIESSPSPDPLVAGEKRRIKIGHYVTQNGKKMADLELEMNDLGSPLTLKQWFGRPQFIIFRDPVTLRVKINLRIRQDSADLLRIWARNIRAQGWIQMAAQMVSGNLKEQGHLQAPTPSDISLAIDLEVADPEGSIIEDDDDGWSDFSDTLSAIESIFPELTETPREVCQFLERDTWDGHLRILLLGQRELTPAQRRWLSTNADIAWYSTSLISKSPVSASQ